MRSWRALICFMEPFYIFSSSVNTAKNILRCQLNRSWDFDLFSPILLQQIIILLLCSNVIYQALLIGCSHLCDVARFSSCSYGQIQKLNRTSRGVHKDSNPHGCCNKMDWLVKFFTMSLDGDLGILTIRSGISVE